jgi:diguanylate cyclase (GGDEF)-like protein
MHKLLSLLKLDDTKDDVIIKRRLLIVRFTLLITMMSFTLFSVINFVLNNILLSILEAIASVILVYTFIYMQKNKNPQIAAKISTFIIITFFMLFIYLSKASHFTLIWSIFIPLYAIFTNGKKTGLIFSILFYICLFSLSYYYINVWDDGNWQYIDWLRLIFASVILTLSLYMYESLLEKSEKELQFIRRLEQKRAKELFTRSMTDELTGLYNRRYYIDTIPKLISLAKRQNLYITFFILDIDYFKQYNDTYGHLKGDQILIKISEVMKYHIQRDEDFVFRLGGEEFAGIVLSKDKEKTHKHICSLINVINELNIEHKASKNTKNLTVSIGIATICNKKDEDVEALYMYADKALYNAKNAGRNQCKISLHC